MRQLRRTFGSFAKSGNGHSIKLYLASGVPQSTLSVIMSCTHLSMKLRIMHEICEGLGIGLEEFFTSPLFLQENLEDKV